MLIKGYSESGRIDELLSKTGISSWSCAVGASRVGGHKETDFSFFGKSKQVEMLLLLAETFFFIQLKQRF